ncbi:protein FAM149B1-like isoform X1 [Asterias amurensis]|uniref:protein FAM149B1-like isoform X1 n=1 Tax=Asterias amurensis TaxID=7602 RepID=UPI003AB1D464
MLAFQPPQLTRTPSSIQLSIATQTPPVIQPSCEITRTRSANPRLTRNRKTSANSSASLAPSIGCRSLTLPRKRIGSSRSAKTGQRTPSHTLPQNGEEAERILSSILSIRGISSRSDNYPTLERPDDIIPMHYLNSVNEAINSYVTPSGSGMSSPSEDEKPNFLMNSGGWTSGNSTERSSLFSWADDEFDKQAGKTVRRMFQEIDDILFEGQKDATTSVQLENECKEWNSRFPHLRVLGKQQITPSDLGYEFIPRSSQTPAAAGELMDLGENEYPNYSSQDPQGLTVFGTRLTPIDPVATMGSSRDEDVQQQLADMEEEIFESDGVIEEYFAYDRLKSWEDEGHELKRYHAPRRKGFPPLTPNACVQNSIYSQAFDVMWTEVVGWIRLLIKRHWHLLAEAKKYTNTEDISSAMSALHPVAPTFDLSLSPYPFSTHMGRGLLDMPSNKLAPMGSVLRLNTAPSLNISLADRQNLTGVMTISSKALHNRPNDRDTRAPSILGDELQTLPLQIGMNRPGSSTLSQINRSNRPMSVKTTDNFNYRLSSARGRGRLRPIDRAKTPNMEGIITGKKLTTASDRLGSPPHPAASPPYHWSRNATLPPIEAVQETLPQLRQPESHGNENKQTNNTNNKTSAKFRISSAAADDRALRLKDRSATFTSESRPNTTHTFRSDTPFGILNRRSSTPQSFTLFKSPAAVPPAGGNPGIMSGITGISLGIPGSSSHIDASVSQYGAQQAGYFKVL